MNEKNNSNEYNSDSAWRLTWIKSSIIAAHDTRRLKKKLIENWYYGDTPKQKKYELIIIYMGLFLYRVFKKPSFGRLKPQTRTVEL